MTSTETIEAFIRELRHISNLSRDGIAFFSAEKEFAQSAAQKAHKALDVSMYYISMLDPKVRDGAQEEIAKILEGGA